MTDREELALWRAYSEKSGWRPVGHNLHVDVDDRCAIYERAALLKLEEHGYMLIEGPADVPPIYLVTVLASPGLPVVEAEGDTRAAALIAALEKVEGEG